MAATLTTGDRNWICVSSDAFPVAGNGAKEGDNMHIIDTGEEYIFFNDMWETDLRLISAVRKASI